jgi:ribosome-associated protein
VVKKHKARPAPKKTLPKKPRHQKSHRQKPPRQKPKAAPKPAAVKSRGRTIDEFSIRLKNAALKILDDRQAEDVVTIDLAGKSSVADFLIIASGRAGRQIAAMADYLRAEFSKHGVKRIRVEGMSEANWVLVDGGDVIVHLFRPEVRRYYNIESIWNNEGDDAVRSSLLVE